MNTEEHGLEWSEGSYLLAGPAAAVGFASERAAGLAHTSCQNSIRVPLYSSEVENIC